MGGGGGMGGGKRGGPCWEGLELPLILANRPLADPGFPGGGTFLSQKRGPKNGLCGDLGGGACSHNLYTSGPEASAD